MDTCDVIGTLDCGPLCALQNSWRLRSSLSLPPNVSLADWWHGALGFADSRNQIQTFRISPITQLSNPKRRGPRAAGRRTTTWHDQMQTPTRALTRNRINTCVQHTTKHAAYSATLSASRGNYERNRHTQTRCQCTHALHHATRTTAS